MLYECSNSEYRLYFNTFDHLVNLSPFLFQITDSDYKILNVRVCPGSNNDRFVRQLSEAKENMENLRNDSNIVRKQGQYYILGELDIDLYASNNNSIDILLFCIIFIEIHLQPTAVTLFHRLY